MAIKAVSADGLRYVITKLRSVLAPKSHASAGTEHGVASATVYGHAKKSGTVPKVNGTASSGTETNTFAAGDHVHPKQAMDKATSSAIGAVRPDGTTTKVDANGVMSSVPPTEQAMFLAAHRVGTYLETDGTNPTSWGGTWQQEPSLGPTHGKGRSEESNAEDRRIQQIRLRPQDLRYG